MLIPHNREFLMLAVSFMVLLLQSKAIISRLAKAFWGLPLPHKKVRYDQLEKVYLEIPYQSTNVNTRDIIKKRIDRQ